MSKGQEETRKDVSKALGAGSSDAPQKIAHVHAYTRTAHTLICAYSAKRTYAHAHTQTHTLWHGQRTHSHKPSHFLAVAVHTRKGVSQPDCHHHHSTPKHYTAHSDHHQLVALPAQALSFCGLLTGRLGNSVSLPPSVPTFRACATWVVSNHTRARTHTHTHTGTRTHTRTRAHTTPPATHHPTGLYPKASPLHAAQKERLPSHTCDHFKGLGKMPPRFHITKKAQGKTGIARHKFTVS